MWGRCGESTAAGESFLNHKERKEHKENNGGSLRSLCSFVAEELAAAVEVDAVGLAGEGVCADFHEDVEEFF